MAGILTGLCQETIEQPEARAATHFRLAAGADPARSPAGNEGISPKNASVHLSNILAKLGVSTRTEAAATVHRLHVLDGQWPQRP